MSLIIIDLGKNNVEDIITAPIEKNKKDKEYKKNDINSQKQVITIDGKIITI